MSRRKEWPLVIYVLLGLLAGGAYVGFDLISEARLRDGTLTGALASAHSLVDHLMPVLAGVLVGLSAYQLRLKARLSTAEEAAERAEALRLRLLKVERDQAVWVVAAAVLHELNNPLHALGLLLDEYRVSTDDAVRRSELVDRAHAQVRRALTHLEKLRSMQGSGEPDEQVVALGQVIGALADDLNVLVSSDGIQVKTDLASSVSVNVDLGYLRAILENLLDNSLHALRAGGGGTVTISLAKEGSNAVVRVMDDGPALDASIRSAVFDPLRTNKSQGLGLGLPIARALARAMRGELVLEEKAHKSFRLELPLGDGA